MAENFTGPYPKVKTSDSTQSEASFAASDGSASESADEWAEIGRDALQQAQDAVIGCRHGSAAEHRKNAEIAFACELKLRQTLNR